MESSINRMCIIPFKKFGMVRINRQVFYKKLDNRTDMQNIYTNMTLTYE